MVLLEMKEERNKACECETKGEAEKERKKESRKKERKKRVGVKWVLALAHLTPIIAYELVKYCHILDFQFTVPQIACL